jgi:hypothetical protein
MHFAHEMWQALIHRVPHGVTPTIAKVHPQSEGVTGASHPIG